MRRLLPVLLVVGPLLLAGCGPAVTTTADPHMESGELFTLALPRIEIEFDEDGIPYLGGVKLVDLGRLVNVDVAGLRIDDGFVAQMTAANIQHVEVRQYGDGLALLANGAVLPHIAWTDETLSQAADVAALFNVQGLDVIRKLLPAVRRLGLDIALRFPLAAGAEAIPLSDPAQPIAVAQPQDADASAIVRLEVTYDDWGMPATLGISPQDLFALGLDPNLPLALAPSVVSSLQERNIQNLEVRTKPDGLYVYVNGSPLPNIVWDDGMVSSAGELYAAMLPDEPYRELIQELASLVDNADIAILVHFPLAPGATPLKAEMH